MASGQPADSVSAPQQNSQNGLNQSFELTKEENEVLKELSREAYYMRSLPLSFGAMLGVATLVKSGALRGHPKFGAIPKMAGAGAFGYFAGKISYIPVMQNKILERLPNSNLAAQIRKAKKLPELPDESPSAQWEAPASSTKASDSYKSLEGLDERFRPSLDREVKVVAPKDEKKSITYEDLRRKNREQYGEEANKNPEQPGSGYKRPSPPSPPTNPDMFGEPNKEPDAPRRPAWLSVLESATERFQGPSHYDIPSQSPLTYRDEDQVPDAQPPPPQQPPARKKRTNIWGDEIDN